MEINDTYVLYHGLNGYGITPLYLSINILTFIVSIATVTLNGVILYILFGRDFREDLSCILISHLALTDFLSGVLLFYNVIYNLIHYKIFYECAFRFGLVNGVFLTSYVFLFALTLERYAKILLPYKYVSMLTPRRVNIFIAVSWFVSLSFCQAPLFGWNQDTSENYCRYFGVFTKTFLLIYCGIMYTMSLLVFLMYCHILLIAFKQSSRIKQQDLNHKQNKQTWWKPTKTALIIVGINVISWMPTGLYVLLASTDVLDHLSLAEKGTIVTYTSSVIYLNGIANPLIYASKIRKVSCFIRKALRLSDTVNYVTEFKLRAEEVLLVKDI